MAPELILALVVVIALNVYALSGGADFGGGVWDLLASGKRADAQRTLIYKAVAPIWEANHVWLILVIVVLFAAFPLAFGAITTALHVPLTIMLMGIVLRGSAFVFRAHPASDSPQAQRRWSRVFEGASIITPVMLGTCLGAVASGRMRLGPNRRVITDFISEWFTPFPLSLGLFTLALFAFLAAVYLVLEADDEALRADFRKRALVAAGAVFVLAFVTLGLAQDGAPRLHEGLTRGRLAVPVQGSIALCAAGAIVMIWTRRDQWARVLAVLQVSGIIWGWALAQYPLIIVPDLTIFDGTAPANVLWGMVKALAVGSVLLVPSFIYLYAVFKRRR